MQDFQRTIISQYANSPILNHLLFSYNAALDPSLTITDWYNNVWNVATAIGWGLDVWGRIVGVTRVVPLTNGIFFGFSNPTFTGASGTPFNQGVFYSGNSSSNNYYLSDNDFRTLIYAKALANISNGSIPAVNAILMTLFGAGNGSGPPTQPAVYLAVSNLNMIVYFSFTPTPVQLAILAYTGAVPRTSGVALSVVHP